MKVAIFALKLSIDMGELDDINTILLCDETKFYLKNGDVEDAIFYFGISVPKDLVAVINKDFKDALDQVRLKKAVFHATEIFRTTRPREKLIEALTQIIIKYRLQCFCFKYPKNLLFHASKNLNYLNNDIIDFNKDEFQALFYFVTTLNTYIRDEKPALLKQKIQMYFDRNVYGLQDDIEGFKFSRDDFLLKQMTFVEKSKIGLLALPDFFGFIFRKAKISTNRVEMGDKLLERSKLAVYSYYSLLQITTAGLFHFVDIDKYIDAIDYLLGLKIDYKNI